MLVKKIKNKNVLGRVVRTLCVDAMRPIPRPTDVATSVQSVCVLPTSASQHTIRYEVLF